MNEYFGYKIKKNMGIITIFATNLYFVSSNRQKKQVQRH